MRTAMLVLACLAVLAAPVAAPAQKRLATPDPRYRLEQVEDGYLRLDTVTGLTSHCRRQGSNWVCTVADDERAALEAELDALRADNKRLTGEIARARGALRRIAATADAASREAQADGRSGRGEARRPARREESEVPEGARREIDSALAVTEYAVRRLFRTFRDLEQELRDEETK